jgi:hypothetical protein
LEEHLALAERHVALGERHIAQQRKIVAAFRRRGHDAFEAEDLLATFERTQVTHVADRDRLRSALAAFR